MWILCSRCQDDCYKAAFATVGNLEAVLEVTVALSFFSSCLDSSEMWSKSLFAQNYQKMAQMCCTIFDPTKYPLKPAKCLTILF